MTATSLAQNFGVSELLVFALVFLACVAVMVVSSKYRSYPPGPIGLPFVGYLPFLGRLPFIEFEKLRKRYGNIFSLKMGARNCVVINGLENIRNAFVLDAFSDRPDFKTFSYINEGKSLSFSNGGPSGKLHRKICVKALSVLLTSSQLSLRYILEDVSQRMRNCFRRNEGEPFEPHNIIRDSILRVIFKICFGRTVDIDTDPRFNKIRKTLDEFIECHLQIFGIDFIPSLERILKYKVNNFKTITRSYQCLVQRELDEHLAEFKEGDIRDVADALIKACNNNAEKMQKLGIGKREILHSVQDFIGAGTQTTSDVILWLIAVLVRNPDIQEIIHYEVTAVDQEEGGLVAHTDFSRLPYLHACILEVGRVRPVAPLAIPHATSKDVIFAGYHIPAGTMVFSNLCSVFLDETLFPNPYQFRPERFLHPDGSFNKTLADSMPMFGTGKRSCIGRSLAEQELVYLMCDLIREFRFKAVPDQLPILDGSFGLTWTPDRFVIIMEGRYEKLA